MLGGVDIRVACPEAKFAVMEPKRGLFAGGGTTVRLPRQIPWPQAMEFLLCADLIPAERALEMGLAQRGRARANSCSTRPASTRERIVANAPLAVQATKQSALQGLYVDEDVDRRRFARCGRRQARVDLADGRRRTPAAIAEVLDAPGQGVAHAVREGEPDLVARSSRPRTRRRARRRSPRSVRRCGKRSERHRSRRDPCIIGVARTRGIRDDVGPEGAPEPLDMWEHVARAAAADAGKARRAHRASTAADSSTARRGSTTTRSQRLADRLGADPKQRHYSGIGGTTAQQLVERHVPTRDARGRAGPRADHERGSAGDASARTRSGASERRIRSSPRRSGRSRGSRRPIRSRSPTRSSRRG